MVAALLILHLSASSVRPLSSILNDSSGSLYGWSNTSRVQHVTPCAQTTRPMDRQAPLAGSGAVSDWPGQIGARDCHVSGNIR